jgi:alcohol dehydrogenase, propanol-preferring
MRAAVFHGGGKPLSVEEVPRPDPGAGEVRITVAGCGFCHTDLHYLDHGVATAHPPPLILGHEVSGRVEALGPGAGSWSVGDRVLVPAVLPCGDCPWCRSGRENICPKLRMLGNHVDGGFAEFVIAPDRDLVAIPPGVDLVKGAIIADALSTPYHAVVHRAQVRPGEWVAVVGCGGVGINVVQFAVAAGASVIAIDLSAEKLALARRLGAVEAIQAGPGVDPAKEARARSGGGVDVAIEAVGTPATIETAFGALRRGGRVCLIGYSDRPFPLAASRLMFFEYSLVGSLGCRPVDYPRIVEMVREGRIKLDEVVTAVMPLDRVNEAADRLRRGEGLRTIVTP